jgi:hypothetical protein
LLDLARHRREWQVRTEEWYWYVAVRKWLVFVSGRRRGKARKGLLEVETVSSSCGPWARTRPKTGAGAAAGTEEVYPVPSRAAAADH